LVVFDDDHRLPRINNPVQQRQQLGHIRQMQTGGRLIQHINAALVPHVGGELEPLPLPTRQGRQRLPQAEIPQPHISEPGEDRVRRRKTSLTCAEERFSPRTDISNTSLIVRPPNVYFSTEAWNRLPSHVSHTVATPAIIAKSV